MTILAENLLDNGVNFNTYKEKAKQTLFESLRGISDGPKCIVWDAGVITQVNMLAGSREIQNGCNVSTMHSIRRGVPFGQVATTHDNVVFVVRPRLYLMSAVADIVRKKKGASSNESQRYHLLFVPSCSAACDHKLESLEVRKSIHSIGSVPIPLYPIDSDVLSMENIGVIRDTFLYNDRSFLNTLVDGLLQLESLYGTIHNIYYKGALSDAVVKLLKRRRKEETAGGLLVSSDSSLPAITSMIVLDRTVDLVTPLVTQLTYLGLIDELFAVRMNAVKLPADKINVDTQQQKEKQNEELTQSTTSSGSNKTSDMKLIPLSSTTDEVFEQLRDLNFNAIGPTLGRTVKTISEELEKRKTATTVRDYKEFVQKLPRLQAARQAAGTHTAIAELVKSQTITDQFLDTVQCEQELLNCIDSDRVMPYVEDAIALKQPITNVLRLICLQSLTSDTNGLKAKVYEQYKREIVQSYGIEYLSLILCLEHCGLLRVQQKPSPLSQGAASWSSLKKSLKLIVNDVDEQAPADLSYAWSGYASTLCRLVALWLKPGWRQSGEVLRKLPGPSGIEDEERQMRVLKHVSSNASSLASSTALHDEARQTVLVVVVGGVTYAEIAALRFLRSSAANVLVATTSIITGNSLILSLGET